MKYVALTLLLAVSALMSCTGSTAAFRNLDRSVEEARELTGKNQPMIDENIAMISAYFEDSDHLLILVGDKETLVDDMSCTSHDQELVAKMFASGIPRFIHLVPKGGLVEGADNRAYIEAPANIKAAIDYVNQFSSHPDAVQDNNGHFPWKFNFSDESREIYNGICQDLGVHHLGLLEDGKGHLADSVLSMNEVGYGERTWNGLPIFGSDSCSWYKIKNTGAFVMDVRWYQNNSRFQTDTGLANGDHSCQATYTGMSSGTDTCNYVKVKIQGGATHTVCPHYKEGGKCEVGGTSLNPTFSSKCHKSGCN